MATVNLSTAGRTTMDDLMNDLQIEGTDERIQRAVEPFIEQNSTAPIRWADLNNFKLTKEIVPVRKMNPISFSGNPVLSDSDEKGLNSWINEKNGDSEYPARIEAANRIRNYCTKENMFTFLNLTELGLTSLPPQIGQLKTLQAFNLAGNKLASLPPQIIELHGLKGLYLNGNQIVELQDEILQLPNLLWLDLQGNRLSSLPEKIGQLTQLQRLDLNGNQIEGLSDLSQKYPCLEKFSPQIKEGLIEWCAEVSADPAQLRGRQSTSQAILDCIENNRSRLSLSGYQLTSLPEVMKNLTNLRFLDLSWNHLEKIPPWIGTFKNLEHLDLASNYLMYLPDSIEKLNNLESIFVEDNYLHFPTPQLIATLKQCDAVLRYQDPHESDSLEIWCREKIDDPEYQSRRKVVEKIRDCVCNGHTQLRMTDYNLTSLPSEIGYLTKVEGMDLSGNQLSSLPAEMKTLTSLKWIILPNKDFFSGPLNLPENTRFIFENEILPSS